jgi:polysaccharide biosynthesis/export protein
VTAEGSVRAPLIGAVRAEGATARELAETLEERYRGEYLRQPQIAVTVEEYRSRPVNIVGEVKQPGVYQLRGRRRLLEVVALAGGFTEAVGETVTVSRGDEGPDTKISVRDLLAERPDDAHNPWIEAQDTIRVSRGGVVYVLGAVRKPGGFPVRDQERMTVLRAVSLASGAEATAAHQKARIIRQSGEDKLEIPVRLKDVLEGRADDAELAANDIVYVPDSTAKSALRRGAEAALQMAVGVVIWRQR